MKSMGDNRIGGVGLDSGENEAGDVSASVLVCVVFVLCVPYSGGVFSFFGALGLLFWFWLFYFLDLAILGGGGGVGGSSFLSVVFFWLFSNLAG